LSGSLGAVALQKWAFFALVQQPATMLLASIVLNLQIEGFLLFGILCYFFVNLYLSRNFGRDITALFTKYHDESSEAEIDGMRSSLNDDFRNMLFSAGRTACVPLRGERIFLVYGTWGRPSFAKRPWISSKLFYALVETRRSEFMKQNSDIFKLEFAGTSVGAYSVNFQALKRAIAPIETS
jgi:hypothetical protein